MKHLAGFQKLPLISDTVDNGQNTTQIELGHPAYVAYVELTPILADKLRRLSTTHNCTLFSLLLTLYNCVLSVFSGDCLDILVGSVLSTRKSQNVPKDLFAPLIKTLVLRTILPESGDATLSDIIGCVQETVLLAMENEACSFADIVTRLRSINASLNDPQQPFLPLFRVLFEMNSYRLVDRQHKFGDDSVWTMYTDLNMIFPFTKSDIDLHAVENGHGSSIHVSFRVNTRLLEPATIEKLAQCYLGAAELVVREPYCTKRILWTELHILRSGLVIHECILNQTRRNPTGICVIQDHSQWSFQQLYDQIKLVTIALQQSFSVQPGTIVGLCMHRSVHLIVAMFGVLMAGAAYVYLDPTLPLQRILKIIKLTSSALVLSDNNSHKFLSDMNKEMPNISFINELYCMGSRDNVSYTYVSVKPTDTCYVIFTSGTTGEPKGICIQHQAVVRRTRMLDYLCIDPSSRIAHVSSCSFDGYILEVYGALLNGACVVIYENAQVMEPKLLSRLFRANSITHVYLPTPIFNMMAEYAPKAFSGMISVMSAGDRANAKLMRRILVESEPPPQQLVNAYGPTEATCISSWYYVTLSTLNSLIEHDRSIPIGTALPDTPLYIVRQNTLELADDGELLVGGFGVSSGYFNLPDQTVAKFLATNPFSTTDQRPLYRSGDHVRRLTDGNLEFIGRFDNQVKIDGCRIELAEIESHIKNHSDVLDAVVIVRNDVIPNTGTIVAYVKPINISPLEIQQYLIKHLPRYMIPACVVPVPNLPIVGGKVDRSSLPKPDMNAASYDNGIQLISTKKSASEKLQNAWQYVLGNERLFKDEDDFFLFGGKSFTVVHLHSMLETLFNIELDIVQLFVHTTFAQQLQWLMSLVAVKKEFDPIATSNSKPSSIDHLHQSITHDHTDKIAIIGMSARYGTTETVLDLWTELCNGSDLCTRVSHDELRKQKHLVEMLNCYPNYVQARCMMTSANCFDHIFFKMTKRDADITDPQHRILLEAAYEALEDAGIVPQDYNGTIGVFASVLPNTYAEVYRLFKPSKTPDELTSSAGMDSLDPASIMRIEIGNMTDGAPTFVAYKLGLTGPAMAIQTACSSSGTALHVALRCIEAGDCDVALVAGASISYPLEAGYIYQPGMVMSKTGFCRSFDERADGVVGGDGVGVIVLMKAKEALRFGYSIRALITGHAVNNDGYKKNSFAITNSDMQAACMSQALRNAHIENAIKDICFVEAHGSGTSLGDLLEVQALTKAYSDGSNSTSKIYLGSIKTNIGHAAHAGTLASIIKATLVVETGIIPPSIHFQQFSPLIAHLKHPFIVNSTCVNCSKTPRRTAVNTLGQGGTNSHFILEQFVSPTMNDLMQMPNQQIFIFSAKDSEALSHVKQKFIAYLPKLKASQRDQVAYTLACGRTMYDARDFIIATSLEQLREKLIILQPCITSYDRPVHFVFLLPGQGAQFAGMARDLYKNYPVCAKIIEQCFSYIKDSIVKQIIIDCLLTTKTPLQSDWNLQCYAQLSLFIVEYALASLFISLNVKPDYLIGHSSGELVAACLAHVFTVEDAINLLERRCQLMTTNAGSRGSMLAVQVYGDADRLRDEFQVEIAAINSKSQYVFSGTHANIKYMEEQLNMRELSRKAKNLSTANAFHSSFMHPLCEQLKKHISHIHMQEPSIPIVSTVTGRMVQERETTTIDYWTDHLKQPVLFGPAIEHLLVHTNESNLFIQVGPGKNLLSLVQNIEPDVKITPPCLLENEESNILLNCIGTLWSQGAVKNIQWLSLFDFPRLKRISLPTYQFKRTICVPNNNLQIINPEKLTGNEFTCICPAPVDTTVSSNLTIVQSQTTTGKAPWNVRKSSKTIMDGCSIKMIELNSKIHNTVLKSSSHSLRLGFYTSIFTRALYFDLIHSGIIDDETLLIDLLPEHMPVDLPFHVSDLSLQQLAAGKSGLLSSSCNSVQELLHALTSSVVNPNLKKDNPDIFGISLLGHSLAAISQMSYTELIHDKIIRPLNLSGTNIIGDDCYAPALGLHSTISDMEHLLISVYGRSSMTRLPILEAIKKAFENYHVTLIGTEQIIPILHLGNDQALLVTTNGNIRKSTLKTIVQQTFGDVGTSTVNKLPSPDYSIVIMTCLQQLTGSEVDSCSTNMTFEQLGVDSLQIITLVELLSRRFSIQFPVDIVYKYPTIATLSDGLQQLLKMNNGISISSPTSYILNAHASMPKVYQSANDRSLSGILKFINCTKQQLLEELTKCGAILFRDFSIFTANEFAQVVRALATTNKSFLDYKDGISKRVHVFDNVFTSTEYPKHVDMALHNEMSYATEMPTQIFFFCEIPPPFGCGGETPIGDSQEIYRSLDPTIRAAFVDRKLLYVHNMPNHDQGLGKSWQDTYQTESKLEVEQFLRSRNIDFCWQPNGSLRTIRLVDAVKKHPVTGEWLWCNHAHLFHPSDLPPDIRCTLESRLAPMDMPKNCFFADNRQVIPDQYLTHVRHILQTHQIKWPWQRGDVLVLDNYRVAHGRAAFSGDRRILVAMC